MGLRVYESIGKLFLDIVFGRRGVSQVIHHLHGRIWFWGGINMRMVIVAWEGDVDGETMGFVREKEANAIDGDDYRVKTRMTFGFSGTFINVYVASVHCTWAYGVCTWSDIFMMTAVWKPPNSPLNSSLAAEMDPLYSFPVYEYFYTITILLWPHVGYLEHQMFTLFLIFTSFCK